MKWLLVLFATYMLLLPCIPCNAADACCDATTEISCVDDCASGEVACEEGDAEKVPCEDERDGTPEERTHHEHNADEERTHHEHDGIPEEQTHHEHSPICPCCPSFSCNTCHSLVISAHFVLEEPSIPVLNFDNASFADEPLSNFSSLIWQPPRGL